MVRDDGEGLGGEKEMVRSENIEGDRTQCAENCQYCNGVILNLLSFYLSGKIHYLIDFDNAF